MKKIKKENKDKRDLMLKINFQKNRNNLKDKIWNLLLMNIKVIKNCI